MTIGREPDVLMDPTTGDLPVYTRIVAGPAVTAQRVSTRLQTHLGDWPLDVEAGVPWTDYLGTKPRDVEALAVQLALEASGVPGVVDVRDLAWTDPPASDEVSITMTIITTDGAEVPLVVQPQGVDGNCSIVVGGVLTHIRPVAP